MKRLNIISIIVFGLIVLAPALPPAEAKGRAITVIHNGRAISIGLAALPVHLAHGDTIVIPCPPNC